VTELGKRVSVAVVAIPIVLVLLYIGGWALALPVAAFAGLGGVEAYRLARASGVRAFEAGGAAAAAALVLVAGWKPDFLEFAPAALTLVGVEVAGVLIAAMFARGPSGRPLAAAAVTVLGTIYTGLSLAVVPMLHALPGSSGWGRLPGDSWAGLVVIALPLACTWIGDAAAYFAGTAWGKAKLAPSISPNKSWVGFWAGLTGAGVAAGVWYLVARSLLPGLVLHPVLAAGIGVLLGVAAVVGDLVESLLKREAGVKDSGTFFPGHGGVLDRLDALVFTLPVAFAALAILAGRP